MKSDHQIAQLRAERRVARQHVWPQPPGLDDGVNLHTPIEPLSQAKTEARMTHLVKTSMGTAD